MKGLIIAAGMSTRLQNRFRDLPKPLLPIQGIPLITHIILTAKKAGITHFVIVVGYKADLIKQELQDGSQLGITIEYIYNDVWEKTTNGVSVLKAKETLQEPFVLMMSDHLFDYTTLQKLKDNGVREGEVVLAVDYNLSSEFIDIDDVTKVKVNGDKILNIGKELREYDCHDTGLFLCSPALFTALEKKYEKSGDCSLSDGIFALSKVGNSKVFDIQGAFWVDVDTEFFVDLVEKKIKNGTLHL